MTITDADHFFLDRTEQGRVVERLHAVADWLSHALDDAVVKRVAFSDGAAIAKPKRRETPLPYNEAAAAAAYELSDTLNDWIETVCTERHLDHPGPLQAVSAARWLARSIIDLALCTQAEIAADQIFSAYNRAIRSVDRPEHRIFQGGCTVCGADLWARPADESITCTACETVIGKRDNDERINMILEDRLFTVDEIITIIDDRFGVHLKHKTIRDMTYRRTQPVIARGVTYDGLKLYRAGDIFDRLRARKLIA